MSVTAILSALRFGPRTNAQLQDAVGDHNGAVARDCAKLIQAGRGSTAIYAIRG